MPVPLHHVRNSDDFLLNRVLDQLRFVVNVEFAHEVELVRFHRFHAEVEVAGDFLDGLAEKVYEFGNKQVKEHLGDIKSFLLKKKMDNLKEIERKVVK